MTWDPNQYQKFSGHRLRPAIDLLSRIDVANPAGVFDLGAGTGAVTRLLAQRWPKALVTGVDGSGEMLAVAAADGGSIIWQQADIATWQPSEKADVLISNAALHWLPDHDRLFPSIMRSVAPGGVLAVQMPTNFSAPSHRSIEVAAMNGPWRTKLEPLIRPSPVREPAFYFDVLSPLCESVDIWVTEYLQVLTGDNPVKEWTKGTWLKPFLDALDAAGGERTAFERQYGDLASAAYPRRQDGTTLFPFKRLFIVARSRGLH